MIWLVSCLLSVFICAVVFAVLLWVKTPLYRLRREQVIRLLEWVLLGQATENDWQVFCEIPIRHDELLESIRLECKEIDEHYFINSGRSGYLLSSEGLSKLQSLLDKLRQQPVDPE